MSKLNAAVIDCDIIFLFFLKVNIVATKALQIFFQKKLTRTLLFMD